MPSEPILDLSQVSFSKLIFDRTAIRARNPHRFEMELLDGIVLYDPANHLAVGFHDLKADAFWTKGHIPGNPIFPGALMIEAGGQLSSFCYQEHFGPDDSRFFGFGGIDKVKFRGMAKPGERLILVCKAVVMNRRFSRFSIQGTTSGRMIFEGEITGIAMPVKADLTSGTKVREAGA
jgi:3-hydroxyacyl-[acyl-carrier-protein] dehydratase